MSETSNERIERAFRERTELLSAMQESVRNAAKQHAAAGELMAIGKDGQVVWVDPVTFQEVAVAGSVESPAATN